MPEPPALGRIVAAAPRCRAAAVLSKRLAYIKKKPNRLAGFQEDRD